MLFFVGSASAADNVTFNTLINDTFYVPMVSCAVISNRGEVIGHNAQDSYFNKRVDTYRALAEAYSMAQFSNPEEVNYQRGREVGLAFGYVASTVANFYRKNVGKTFTWLELYENAECEKTLEEFAKITTNPDS